MNKPNFAEMTKAELRVYVLEHRNDDEAFHAFMDKVYASPRVKVRSMEHLVELIKAKQKASEERSD
ncbi:DUF6887 family protein [Phormidesmis sp. 146-12]